MELTTAKLISIKKRDIETGISKFMPGQIWVFPLSDMDDVVINTFRKTKDRPYIITSVTNNVIEAIPITSTNVKNNDFFIPIPRVLPDDKEISYVAIPNASTFDVRQILQRYPTYKMSVHPKMLKKIVATLLAFRYRQYFESDEMVDIVENCNEIYNNMDEIEYYSSSCLRYNVDIKDNDKPESVDSGTDISTRKNNHADYDDLSIFTAIMDKSLSTRRDIKSVIGIFKSITNSDIDIATIFKYCDELNIKHNDTHLFCGVKTTKCLKKYGITPIEYSDKFGAEITAKIFGVSRGGLASYKYRMKNTPEYQEYINKK